MNSIRILLVEDDPTDRLLLSRALDMQPGFAHELVTVSRLSQACDSVESDGYDIILLDLGLPDSQGLDTFVSLHDLAPEIPIVVFTGYDNEEMGTRAIQQGAQDYLVKGDTGPLLLTRTIRYAIERKRAAQDLAISEERFDLAIKAADAGLWDWNPRTDSIYLAPRFKEILGYSGEGMPDDASFVRDRIVEEDREPVRVKLLEHLQSGAPFDIEYRVRRESGEVCWVQSRGEALRDGSGAPYRMVGWIIEVTERRRIEEELRRSREGLRRLAARTSAMIEEERTRISREVHDELGQGLTALKMDIHWMRSRMPEDTATGVAVRERLEQADILTDRTIEAVQRISRELRPSSLDHLGLCATIREEARLFERRSGLNVRLDLPDPAPQLDAPVSTAAFRILQELLTNVVRHAKASNVVIQVRDQGDTLTLCVRDDGVGIPAKVDRNGSLGLLGMEERAVELGGSIVFDTKGQGTAATVRIPLPYVTHASARAASP